jgi:hypothetical protein
MHVYTNKPREVQRNSKLLRHHRKVRVQCLFHDHKNLLLRSIVSLGETDRRLSLVEHDTGTI